MFIVIGAFVNRSTSKTTGYCKERVLNQNMTVLSHKAPVYESGEISHNVQNSFLVSPYLQGLKKNRSRPRYVVVLRIKCLYLTIKEMFFNL